MESNIFSDRSELLLMCKNRPVYNISQGRIINYDLVPGCLLNDYMTYNEWMRTRYSFKSNTSSRRLMMRAFQSESHDITFPKTRALSLSDCYWLKGESEEVTFEEVTPYLNKDWDGNSEYIGGSISTLFVNGAANKRWDSKDWLRKFSSPKEYDVYKLAEWVGVEVPEFKLEGKDFLVKNFTSIDMFLESFEQSGEMKESDNHLERGVEILGEEFVKLLTLDYIVEHDDRHSGNFGFLRETCSGRRMGISPAYDFDWCFSGWSIPLPKLAWHFKNCIEEICELSIGCPSLGEHREIINKRSLELLKIRKGI